MRVEGSLKTPSLKKHTFLSTLPLTQKKLTPKATPAGTQTVTRGVSLGCCYNQVQHIPE